MQFNQVHVYFFDEKLKCKNVSQYFIYKLKCGLHICCFICRLCLHVINCQWSVFLAGLIFIAFSQKSSSMIPGTPRSSGLHHYVPQTISYLLMLWWTSLQFVAEQMSPVKTISVYNMLTYLWPNPTRVHETWKILKK